MDGKGYAWRSPHGKSRKRNQLQTVVLLSIGESPLFLLSSHFFRVYLNSLIIYLKTIVKERTPEDSKLLGFEVKRAKSPLRNMQKTAPSDDLLALHRKVMLTEYY